jgi:ABC-type transport system substrate-binding protein
MFSEMQLLMAEDVAAIWVAWYDWTPVWRANVKGFHVAPTYYDYFDTVSVE